MNVFVGTRHRTNRTRAVHSSHAVHTGRVTTPAHPHHVPAFFVKQRITVMVNRYEVFAANPGRHRGPPAGIRRAEADEAEGGGDLLRRRGQDAAGVLFKARQRPRRARRARRARRGRPPLGTFKKEFGASLLRSTWNLRRRDGRPGQERRPVIAILRRVWTSCPTSATSGCRSSSTSTSSTTPTGQAGPGQRAEKAIRDRYDVTVPDPRVDFRVAAAMAVALDALQSR